MGNGRSCSRNLLIFIRGPCHPENVVPPHEVLSALDRLLASDTFIHSERMSAFLRFAVRKALAGEGDHLKEYLLGTEVFGKGQDFDPRLDPIVRVEARRLRGKLQEYYEGPGKADPVRITFRKGGYAPSFERAVPQQDSDAPVPIRRTQWIWMAAGLLVATGVGVWLTSRAVEGPVSVVVFPTGEELNDRPFEDGLAQAVALELARDPRLRVVAWPRFAEYRKANDGLRTLTIEKTAKDMGVGRVLTVSVEQRQNRRRIFSVLMNPGRGFKQWAGEYERGVSDEFAVQRELARAISDDVRAKF